jgi:hypothetical protein
VSYCPPNRGNSKLRMGSWASLYMIFSAVVLKRRRLLASG